MKTILLLLFNVMMLNHGVPVFTLHESGEEVIFYTDCNMTEARFTIHPYKSENNAGVMLELIYSLDDCLCVKIGDETPLYCPKGSLAINTRNYNDTLLVLYQYPDSDSEISGFSSLQQTVRIYGIEGDWLYVKAIDDQNIECYGWIPPEMQCFTPWTSCP